MKGREIGEEKASIYDNDGEDYDESNVLEENTATGTSDKRVVSTCKWQEWESDPYLVVANLIAQPPSSVHLSNHGEKVGLVNHFWRGLASGPSTQWLVVVLGDCPVGVSLAK